MSDCIKDDELIALLLAFVLLFMIGALAPEAIVDADCLPALPRRLELADDPLALAKLELWLF